LKQPFLLAVVGTPPWGYE